MIVIAIGEMTTIATATEEMTTIATATEEMTTIVTVTEEMITTVTVTDEMSVLGREVAPVAVIMMILSRQEPLAAFRIRVPVVARRKVNNWRRETPIMAFPLS